MPGYYVPALFEVIWVLRSGQLGHPVGQLCADISIDLLYKKSRCSATAGRREYLLKVQVAMWQDGKKEALIPH